MCPRGAVVVPGASGGAPRDSGPVGVSLILTGIAVSDHEKAYPRVAGGREALISRRVNDSGNGGFVRFTGGNLS
jgi:hypothetical protein